MIIIKSGGAATVHACISYMHKKIAIGLNWSRSNDWDFLLLLNMKEMETSKIGKHETWDQ